jgi:hypothetical protein
MSFTPTHNMQVLIKGETKKMPVVLISNLDGVCTIETRSGKIIRCNEAALTRR